MRKLTFVSVQLLFWLVFMITVWFFSLSVGERLFHSDITICFFKALVKMYENDDEIVFLLFFLFFCLFVCFSLMIGQWQCLLLFFFLSYIWRVFVAYCQSPFLRKLALQVFKMANSATSCNHNYFSPGLSPSMVSDIDCFAIPCWSAIDHDWKVNPPRVTSVVVTQ